MLINIFYTNLIIPAIRLPVLLVGLPGKIISRFKPNYAEKLTVARIIWMESRRWIKHQKHLSKIHCDNLQPSSGLPVDATIRRKNQIVITLVR